MGKKTIIGLLSFLSAITLGFGLSACSCGKNDNQGAQAVVEGFEIKESISVNVGTVIDLEQPIVTDSKGVLLDCWTYVTDAKGNYVATSAGSFTAENAGVYTIIYVVRDSANNTFEKKTIVNVTGEVQTGEVTLDVDFEQFIVTGEPTKINAVCSSENAELVYSVKKASTGAAVEVNGNEFTPEEAGVYQVTVSVAGGGADPYTYNVFAEAAAKEGEVEAFGEAWAEKETFIGGKRQEWEIVSSEECNLVDPYGRIGTFAKYSTDRAYIPLFINIRQDNDYYKQLANEGYTHVSMWIYMDSQKPHISISDRDPNGGFYRREGPNLYPGQWTEFRLSLVDTKSSWTRSFTTCYNMYDNQSHFYLQVDNSYEYNLPWGGGDNITFYFTDIYAIKDVEIGKAEAIETEKTVGDTVDLSTVFSADFDLDYTVSCRGERTAVDGAQYTFKANGEYTVTAVPKAWDLRGSQSVTFTVTDGFALTSSPVIKERTAESVSVPVSELNAVFTTVDGVTPTIESYKAYFNGTELPVENGAFTAAQDGAYTVEIKGVYGEYASYHTVPVDVYSQATKYTVIDVNHLRTIRAWDWDSSKTTAEYGEYEVDGKTGNYVKATAKGQSLVLYAKPMFSKTYYEALAAQYADTKLLIDVYFVPAAEGKTTNFRSIYNPNKSEWFDKHNNEWQTYEMSIADFIAVYDDVSGRYEQYKSASFGAGTDGYEGSWLQLIGSQMDRTVYMDVSLGVEATEASVSLKEGASVKVDTDNNLTELFDITISGESGKLVSAEVYFNNEWVEIEKGIFNPAWEVEYQVRFNIESADGFKYKQVETTVVVGDGSFTATVDTDFYSVEIGNTFDVTNLLTEDYSYSVKLLRSINGEQTVVAEYNDGVIQTNDLASGSYQVNVYATKGNGAYASILYYTLTLDVWSAETKYDVMDTQNMKVLRAWNWGSTSFVTGVGEYTAGGRTGNYVTAKSNSGCQSLVIYAKPLYSKAYYEALYAENAALSVRMELFHIPGAEGHATNFWSVFTNGTLVKFTDQDYNNIWLNYSISLESFIASYDALNNKYEAKKSATEAEGDTGNATAWIYITGGGLAHTVYFDTTIALEAETASVSLKENASLAVNTDNNLNALLDVKLDEEAGEIYLAEVYFNNEWVTLSSCIFNPAWAANYLFRFQVQTAGGVKYKQVETTLTVGDGSFEMTEDTDAHIVKTGESFDVATLLSEEYTYEMETYKSYGGTLTKVDVADGKVLKAENLEIGAYFIKVYAIDGEGAFSKILYYTLFVDYVGDGGAELMGDFTADNYKTLFKSYQYSSNQHMTDTTVTTECPTGNSGTFLKYEGRSNNRKEAMSYAFKPLFSPSYYAGLAKSGEYVVSFDVWIENVDETCARENGYVYTWNTAGTKFTTHGTNLAVGQWHTIEIPLETLAKNMANGEFKFFGIFIPRDGFTTADLVRMYMGNFEIVNKVNEA